MYMHILALFLAAAFIPAVTPRELPRQSSAAVAQFRPVETCELMGEPEETNSPHPILRSNRGVVVDFIVGYDGNVYSAFVLESTDQASANEAMRLIKTWRFHPATCNKIPINAEGRVTFFSR